jgi:hypothetical protein
LKSNYCNIQKVDKFDLFQDSSGILFEYAIKNMLNIIISIIKQIIFKLV